MRTSSLLGIVVFLVWIAGCEIDNPGDESSLTVEEQALRSETADEHSNSCEALRAAYNRADNDRAKGAIFEKLFEMDCIPQMMFDGFPVGIGPDCMPCACMKPYHCPVYIPPFSDSNAEVLEP